MRTHFLFGALLLAQKAPTAIAATPPRTIAVSNKTCPDYYCKVLNPISWDWPELDISSTVVATLILNVNTNNNVTRTSTIINNASFTGSFDPGFLDVDLVDGYIVKTLIATMVTQANATTTVTTVITYPSTYFNRGWLYFTGAISSTAASNGSAGCQSDIMTEFYLSPTATPSGYTNPYDAPVDDSLFSALLPLRTTCETQLSFTRAAMMPAVYLSSVSALTATSVVFDDTVQSSKAGVGPDHGVPSPQSPAAPKSPQPASAPLPQLPSPTNVPVAPAVPIVNSPSATETGPLGAGSNAPVPPSKPTPNDPTRVSMYIVQGAATSGFSSPEYNSSPAIPSISQDAPGSANSQSAATSSNASVPPSKPMPNDPTRVSMEVVQGAVTSGFFPPEYHPPAAIPPISQGAPGSANSQPAAVLSNPAPQTQSLSQPSSAGSAPAASSAKSFKISSQVLVSNSPTMTSPNSPIANSPIANSPIANSPIAVAIPAGSSHFEVFSISSHILLPAGPVTTIQGGPFTIATPTGSAMPKLLTIGSQTFAFNGQEITVSGTPVSIVVPAGLTEAKPFTIGSEIIFPDGSTTIVPGIPGASVVSADSTSTKPFVVGSQTLVPGGPAATVSGTVYSVVSKDGSTDVVVGSSTVDLGSAILMGLGSIGTATATATGTGTGAVAANYTGPVATGAAAGNIHMDWQIFGIAVTGVVAGALW